MVSVLGIVAVILGMYSVFGYLDPLAASIAEVRGSIWQPHTRLN